ncbi:MAG: hypothetical protein AAF074_06795 [Pseudomonadota bacterium]
MLDDDATLSGSFSYDAETDTLGAVALTLSDPSLVASSSGQPLAGP